MFGGQKLVSREKERYVLCGHQPLRHFGSFTGGCAAQVMRFLWLLTVVVVAAKEDISSGGSCGSLSVPYRLLVNDEGRPEIACITPSCIVPSSSRSQRSSESRIICSSYSQSTCSDELQWTGGLIEVNNGTHRTLKTECCEHSGMQHSKLSRTVYMREGDEVVGGLFKKAGYDSELELIKEVSKRVEGRDRTKVSYVVTMVKIPCRGGYIHGHTDTGRQGKSRRPLMRQLLRDLMYYDDDLEFSGRDNLRQSSPNSLWPIQYSRPKQRGGITYAENDFFYDETGTPAPTPAREDYNSAVAPNTETPSYVEETAAPAPVQSYNPQPGPVPPSGYMQPPSPGMISSPIQSTRDNFVANSNVAPQPTQFSAPNSYANSPNSYGPSPQAMIDAYEVAQVQPQPLVPPPPQPQQTVYQTSYQGSCQPAVPSCSAASSCCSAAQPSLNDIFSQMQCFHGNVTVRTPTGPKRMDQLEIGDLVLTMEDQSVSFSPVIMFLHKMDDQSADFLSVETESSKKLLITPYHLIHLTNCRRNASVRLIPAMKLKTGDCLLVIDDHHDLHQDRVKAIKKVPGVGIYAPLTASGDLFVEGIFASCHSNLALKTLQQTYFSTYRMVSGTFRSFLSEDDRQDLPYGVEFLTSAMDVLLPISYM